MDFLEIRPGVPNHVFLFCFVFFCCFVTGKDGVGMTGRRSDEEQKMEEWLQDLIRTTVLSTSHDSPE